jgi:hypothetical protein
LQELVAQALGYAYFGNFDGRVEGLDVVFTAVEFVDFSFCATAPVKLVYLVH